jgi:hypothetical protein
MTIWIERVIAFWALAAVLALLAMITFAVVEGVVRRVQGWVRPRKREELDR